MRSGILALLVIVSCASSVTHAHGPQLQITIEAGKLVTRQLLGDGPYSPSLTAPTSLYVMPLLPFNGVWYSRPNGALNPILGTPAFLSGPGIAYGYDLTDGGPQAFAAGSIFSLQFTAGLKKWDGTAFADAGAAELKAYRGSNVNIASPPENFAITSDAGPFDNLLLPAVAANYGNDGDDVHNSISYSLLADGASPGSSNTSASDGIYLASLRLSNSQVGVTDSDEFFFLLHKNADLGSVDAAATSLGIDSGQVQWLNVPEPGSGSLLATLVAIVLANHLTARRRQRGTP